MERYKIIREIARGASGVVYVAHDRELDLRVALKQIRHSAEQKRFLREARLAARLDHPGIVRVLGFGIHDGRPYFTMPRIEGRPLSDLLKPGPLSEARAVAMAGQIAEALEHAHERGVIHRDIKPSNILITDEGRIVLVDFGLARDIRSSARLTQSCELLGTPLYMAPEQMMPGGDAGSSADVYAFGCVLYEMLTGRPPFSGDTFIELSSQVLNEDPPPPEGVSEPLARLCLSCLSRDPGERPTIAEVATRLIPAHERPRRRGWYPLVSALAVLSALLLSGSPYLDARLTITSNPTGAVVQVNGRLIGRTPVRAFALPPGPNLIRLLSRRRMETLVPFLMHPGRQTLHVDLPPLEEGLIFVDRGEVLLDSPARGLRRVKIGPIFVEVTEVTGARYSEFIRTTGTRLPLDWRTSRPPAGKERHAVSGVSAFDAEAFARWRGMRLPTDDEWEALARGVRNRAYPWGRGLHRIDVRERTRGPVAAGRTPYDISPFRIHDMGGGLREWTATLSSIDSNLRVVRGGSWKSSLLMRDLTRHDEVPSKKRDRLIGFRCVRDRKKTTEAQRK